MRKVHFFKLTYNLFYCKTCKTSRKCTIRHGKAMSFTRDVVLFETTNHGLSFELETQICSFPALPLCVQRSCSSSIALTISYIRQNVTFGSCGLSFLPLRSLWFQLDHFCPCGFQFKQSKSTLQFLSN